MSELREVLLSRVHANPFRDIDNYPFWRDKLDRLKESMKSTFAWPNIIVRQRKDGEYELAFGHHRVQAMRELEFKKISVIIEPLSDDQMLKMMADENAEEFGTNFALGTMNAVSAVVKAFGAGVIKLDPPGEEAKTRWRYAPSFVSSAERNGEPYSTLSVAKYLGWTHADPTNKGGLRASDRVSTAVAALELIELGVCKSNAFQGLGHDQAKAVVQQAQLVYKSRMRELDKKAEEKEVRAAQREAVKDASKAVTKVVGALKDGAGVREIRDETSKIRQQVATVPTQKKQDPLTVDISRMIDRAAGEIEDAVAKLEILAERHSHNMLKLYAQGAICDKGAEKRYDKATLALAKVANNFSNHFTKSKEKRG